MEYKVKGRKPTRDGYGKKLVELGEKDQNIVVLDADLAVSTRTVWFGEKFPDRFFNMGIAEANMIGYAAGLALSGKIVFASTFAIFLTGRAWEQIRQSIAGMGLNVKLAASHAGVSVGEDGFSHQATEDIAIMRAIPGMKVFVPADAIEAAKCTEVAAYTPGPVYIRLGRASTPIYLDENYHFEPGKGVVLKDGKDVSIIAIGNMVYEGLKAAYMLEDEGISCRVVNMSSVVPIDKELLLKCAEETRFIVSCEEHNVVGGLSGAITEYLSEVRPTRVIKVGIPQRFGESGDPQNLFKLMKIDYQSIAQRIREALNE